MGKNLVNVQVERESSVKSSSPQHVCQKYRVKLGSRNHCTEQLPYDVLAFCWPFEVAPILYRINVDERANQQKRSRHLIALPKPLLNT